MAATVTLPPATGWDSTDNVVILGNVKAAGEATRKPLEPAGRHFQAFANRRKYSRTFSEQERVDEAKKARNVVVEEEEEEEEESKELLSLDPRNWKEQDHYAVLGLSKLRWRATEEDFKRAYRKKVLRHHPDKKAASHGGRTDDDSFFKCIQKAYDILMDPVRRMWFDSVDPTFDDSVPTKIKGDFYSTFGPVFERNAHFSKIQPVPALGDENATYEEVTKFYDFWYNFDSWRVFNYLDEEDTMNAENREDKRWMEKKNKKQREERKKEDIQRIRKLVDTAMALDPRIARLKQEEKERKAREKESKRQGGAAKDTNAAAAAEAKKAAEEAAAAKAAAEAAAKEAADKEKQQREAKKKALQKERKTLRRILKARNYLLPEDTDLSSPEMLKAIERSEQLCSDLPLEELTELNASMIKEPENAWKVYMAVISRVFGADAVTAEPEYVPGSFSLGKGEGEEDDGKGAKAAPAAAPAKTVEPAKPAAAEAKPAAETKASAAETAAASPAPAAAPASNNGPRPWDDKEVAALIKGVKQIPAGTRERWSKVTKYVNEHSGMPARTENEVVAKAKAIAKEAGSGPALDTSKIEKKHNDTVIREAPTQRVEIPDEAPAASAESADAGSSVWTPKELEMLQEALRKYPANVDKRWDLVAAFVGTKNKKECMSKVKKIAQQIKEKQQHAAA